MDPGLLNQLQALVVEMGLTQEGWPCRYKSEPYNVGELKKDYWDNLIDAINLVYEPKSKLTSRKALNSYAVKHVVEQLLSSPYCSNATVILAFKYLGYQVIPYRDGGYNVKIYAEQRFNPEFHPYLVTYLRKFRRQCDSVPLQKESVASS